MSRETLETQLKAIFITLKNATTPPHTVLVFPYCLAPWPSLVVLVGIRRCRCLYYHKLCETDRKQTDVVFFDQVEGSIMTSENHSRDYILIAIAIVAGITTVWRIIGGQGFQLVLLSAGWTVYVSSLVLRRRIPYIDRYVSIVLGIVGIVAYEIGLDKPGDILTAGIFVFLGIGSVIDLILIHYGVLWNKIDG